MKAAIIYSTQTGTSAHVAHLIKNVITNGYNNETIYNKANNDYESCDIADILIYVVSTHGDGTHPFSFHNFWSQKKLPECDFAVFGLGDSSYDKFNYASKRLFNRLKIEGNKPIIRRGEGDMQDENGIYTDLKKWLEELSLINLECAGIFNIAEVRIENLGKKIQITRVEKRFYEAKVASKQILTPEGYENRMMEVEFEIPDYKNYKPGDVIGITPDNYNFNNFVADCISDNNESCKNRDINFVPPQTLFFHLFAQSGIEIFKNIATDYDHYFRYILRPRRTFYEVLVEFQLKVDKKFIESHVPLIQPRFFTLIKWNDGKIEECEKNSYKIILSLVEFSTYIQKKRLGLVSQYFLKEDLINTTISVEIIPSTLNLNNRKFLCICTGAGVSLPLSLLNLTRPESVLIYGFRHKGKDMLYPDLLERNFDMNLAISREGAKEYVQNVLNRLIIEKKLSNFENYNILISGNTKLNGIFRNLFLKHGINVTFQSETW